MVELEGINMKILNLILVSLILCGSSAAYAVKGEGQVMRIYPHGNVYFRLKGDDCKDAGQNSYWFFRQQDNPMADYWLSMLLSAAATGQTVKVGSSSGIANCNPDQNEEIAYILIDY